MITTKMASWGASRKNGFVESSRINDLKRTKDTVRGATRGGHASLILQERNDLTRW